MGKIKIGIIGVGNCASALVQGLTYYGDDHSSTMGLAHPLLGGYSIRDIEVVFAVDIDERKVGIDLADAIFAQPNCASRFCWNIPKTGVIVSRGVILDGISQHIYNYPVNIRVSPISSGEATLDEMVNIIRASGAEMLINYLPVGSHDATCFYANCALNAGVGFINCMPVFIASDPVWIERFRVRGLPCMGDDIKSQLGATIVHRELIRLFEQRGIEVTHTYQLNTGGNMDFLNMLNKERLHNKKISKTSSVQSNLQRELLSQDIHVGPSDFVEWQKDNKICFLRIEGKQFGGHNMNLELRLSVEDSPNSAGIVVDAIRCMRIALDRHLIGDIQPPSTCFMKHPRIQAEEFESFNSLKAWLAGKA